VSVPWTLIVHSLHVMAGMVWGGGAIFMALVGWRALLDRPPSEARPLFERVGKVMAISGSLVLVLGVVRGTALGPVRSWDFLIGSAYGRTFGLALVVTVLLAIHGARGGRTLPARLWDGDRWRPEAAGIVRRDSAINVIGLAVVVLCMCAMHFGL
jgi:uncharacterized membrane protein